jgi:hypothetical protein
LSVPGRIEWITLASNCSSGAVTQQAPENLPLFA